MAHERRLDFRTEATRCVFVASYLVAERNYLSLSFIHLYKIKRAGRRSIEFIHEFH